MTKKEHMKHRLFLAATIVALPFNVGRSIDCQQAGETFSALLYGVAATIMAGVAIDAVLALIKHYRDLSDCHAALEELVYLKCERNDRVSEEEYQRRKPLAWTAAMQALLAANKNGI